MNINSLRYFMEEVYIGVDINIHTNKQKGKTTLFIYFGKFGINNPAIFF